MFIVVERWITRTVLGLIVVVILTAAFIWGSGGNDQPPGSEPGDARWTTNTGTDDLQATPASTSSQAGADGVTSAPAEVAAIGRTDSQASSDAEAVTAGTTGDFFARFRLDRARTRSQQMELYTRMLSDASVDAQAKEEAQKELMVLAAQEEKETAVENLLRARGYDEALVVLDQRGATVVIPDEVMTREKAAQIGELVQRMTGVPLDSISILPVGV
ncbi:MAG: SpoIIIAH-like family protein [Limnochordales bacterium]|nr:SpoIIIAH-like family protein [Limnochordales bacterium]